MDPRDLRELETTYRSFPAFEEWQQVPVDSVAWQTYINRFEASANQATRDQLAEAETEALRVPRHSIPGR